MTIETLMKAAPPPATPFEAFSGPWEPIEAELATALPQDYKDFVRFYGIGHFLEFLGVNVPRSQNPNCRLEQQVREVCESFFVDQHTPFALWPNPMGLIPFGATDNGDYLFWLPSGAPADWRIVVWDRAFLGFETFDCDMTDFLAGLATGRIQPKGLPDDLLPNDCPFKPHSAQPLQRRRAAHLAVATVNLSWRLGNYGTGPSGSSACRLRDDK